MIYVVSDTHVALTSFSLKSHLKKDFLFQLVYNAINFLIQFGKHFPSLFHSTYTTCTVTDDHKNIILEEKNWPLSLFHLEKNKKDSYRCIRTRPGQKSWKHQK